MAANKRKQDEKHLKILREMVTSTHNKYCFDCNQRGPTYVNMTTGSFVCTSCSGMLRGLNPPHRVKSISMTSFTPEEMDFLKCHGNHLCRKVWLALYDSRSHNEADSKDDQKRKDFLVQKYERKRWHQAPTDAMLQEARVQNDTQAGKKETKPLKTLLGHNATRLVVSENQSSARPVVPVTHSNQSQARTVTPSLSQGSIGSTGSYQSTSSQPNRSAASSTNNTTGGAFDLLADLGTDPFAPKTAPPPVQKQTNPTTAFANFESAFTNFSAPAAPMASSVTAPPAGVPPVSQHGLGVFATAGTPQPNLATSQPQQAAAAAAAAAAKLQSDRYAALADLDNLFGSSSGQAINWDSQFSSPPRNASVATSHMGGGWGGQTVQPQTSVQAPNPFSSTPNNFSQPHSAPNPFAGAPVSQPAFAAPLSQPSFAAPISQSAFAAPISQPAFSTIPQQMPFGGYGTGTGTSTGTTPAVNQNHFSQSNSFPAFPAQNNSSYAPFPSSQSAFGAGAGAGELQNNGFNGWTAMKAGYQAQQTTQHGGFAQWGQMAQTAAPNPFMNISAQQGVPAKVHSTNPFL